MPFSTPMTIAILFTTWFIVLFAVLPFGVRSQQEEGTFVEGTDPGAPVAPKLWIKAVWTTVLTAVVFGMLVALVRIL
jgi:predicted secreted protein